MAFDTQELVKLGDWCKVVKGLSYKGKFIHQEGPALLGIGTIREGGGFRPENVRTYGGPYKPENILRPGDVYVALTSQDGLLIGSVAKVPADFQGFGITTHHDAKIEWLTDDADIQSFLYWVMHSHEFINHCIYFSTGTTVYATKPEDVERFEVPLKLSNKQIRISKILNMVEEAQHLINESNDSLDSLIGEVFRAWFIDFIPLEKEPDSEPTKMKETILGTMPSDWDVKFISDIYSSQKGHSYSSKELCNNDEGTPMINLGSVIGGGGYKKSGLKHINSEIKEKNRIQELDVLIATVDLTPDLRVVGSPLIPPPELMQNASFSQDLLALRPLGEFHLGRNFLFQWIKHRRGIMQKWSNGTTVSRFPEKIFEYFPVPIPPTNLLSQFDDLSEATTRYKDYNRKLMSILESIKKKLLAEILI